jgi:signal transduction histidine kinase
VLAERALLAENARVAERLALSRELHDVLGHHLAALSQHLELAQRRSDGEAAVAAARAGELVRRLLARLRRTVSALRRPASLDLGLALRTLAQAAPDLQTDVVVAGELQLAPVRGAVLFRCACEGVAAALRAGGRQRVRLELRIEAGGHILSVEIAPARTPGPSEEALRGLRTLLAPLGGALEASALPGGFRLQAVLPAPGAAR